MQKPKNPAKTAPKQARGEARKRTLIDAVISVLAREGAAGVTHRSVAEAAGAKHGSVRYYFATREEMLTEALNLIVLRQADEVRELFETHQTDDDNVMISALADKILDRIKNHRDGEMARYELFLTAARTGQFKETLDAWAQSYVETFLTRAKSKGHQADPEAMQQLLNLLNGLILQQLAAPTEEFRERVLVPILSAHLGTNH